MQCPKDANQYPASHVGHEKYAVLEMGSHARHVRSVYAGEMCFVSRVSFDKSLVP